MLVPYSYDWYDHLEQYFITPERRLFPLNFGLSRSAGLMAHGLLFDDRLQYAVGGFDGHLDRPGRQQHDPRRGRLPELPAVPPLGAVAPAPLPERRRFGLPAASRSAPSTPCPCGRRSSRPRTTRRRSRRRRSSSTSTTNAGEFGGRSATALHLAWYVGRPVVRGRVAGRPRSLRPPGCPGPCLGPRRAATTSPWPTS